LIVLFRIFFYLLILSYIHINYLVFNPIDIFVGVGGNLEYLVAFILAKTNEFSSKVEL